MQSFDLEHAVAGQSWDWLFAVSRRLDIVVELLDARHVPLLPPGPSVAAAEFRRLLAAREHESDDDRYEVLCTRLSPDGLLLLAREPEDESPDACRRQLDCLSAWLTAAIEISLTSPPDGINAEAYRIASLERTLTDAASYGTARTVIGAFVEAIGVWDGLRVRAYAAGADGGFLHFVSPVGAAALLVPPAFGDGDLPRGERIVRLAPEEAERLGFGSDTGDVLLMQLFAGNAPGWLIVCSGHIDAAAEARLMFYGEILREALDAVHTNTTQHVAAGLPQHQLGRNESLDAGANAALQQLTAAIGGQQAALTVTTVTGIRALALGDQNLLPAPDAPAPPDRLVVTSADTASVMTVVVAREQPPFMAFERDIVNEAVAVLHPWIQTALQRTTESERRRRFKPLENVFDQLAARAVDAGREASVIVVSVDAMAATPDLLQTWLGLIRIQLRAGDFAGLLSDSEIAVLLCDASADQAAIVSARLKQLVESHRADEGDGFVRAMVAVTTRSPELPFEGSLVGAARAVASQR